GTACAQDSLRVYPTNWWVGMKYNDVQVMVHSRKIGDNAKASVDYPGVQLLATHGTENPNYLFLQLRISAAAKPGIVPIRVDHPGASGTPIVIRWPLLVRRPGNGTRFAQGVRSSDFIYFLMPDRYSDGDPGNDRISGLRDQSLDRDSIFLRHGGDFQGIIDHLDYLQTLGVTTLWMTPVLENDMPNRTEHGYAITDHYTVERRLGGAALYKRLSDSLHRRGMKLIQDAVYNHVGLYHFLVQDLPAKDWLHQWPSYTQTNYKDQPLLDPHASRIDKKTSSDGWFTRQMPDLNQGNPDLAKFLIQHAVWCVETFGVDGWRIDTYIYNDLDFMNRCNKALTDEYPRITMFGEAWVNGTANQAYFVRNHLDLPYKSNLTGATDFQCNFNGIVPAMADTSGYGSGVNSLYSTLADDFLYQDPTNNVIFLDNHDMSRFFSQIGENVARHKMGIEWLLTCRGIPQMYYGTEVLMKGFANPDGWVRLDFPGGWKGDHKNAFTGQGLSAEETSVQELVRTLGRFRLASSALRTGKMMQYLPVKGLYVYFRYDERQTVLCVMNTGKEAAPLNFERWSERTTGFNRGVDILTGREYKFADAVEIPPNQMWVLELRK
ncbi:MAG TPA: alpha-amylase family glycosyl hydrolase, partial [Puia sp.]|nr:alpha-amylase family glycosyl hydrolase [Puia sp.]